MKANILLVGNKNFFGWCMVIQTFSTMQHYLHKLFTLGVQLLVNFNDLIKVFETFI